MQLQEPLGEGWFAAALLIALPILFFLFFKSMTAKTRKAHFAYFCVIVVIMLALFGFLMEAGLMFSPEQMQQLREAKKPDPSEALAQIPLSIMVVFGLVVVIWIGGANWIVIRQTLKAGRPWWTPFIPFTPTFRDMDRRSWLQLLLLMFLGFVVFAVGMNLVQSAPGPSVEESSQN